MSKPRVLIEEWLPAQAIGIECMRARGSASALEPTTYLHVWWARKPLTVSRAAVLASLLPADFDRATFERLLGFYDSSQNIVRGQEALERVRQNPSVKRIKNPHGPRAFSNAIPEPAVEAATAAMAGLWGEQPTVLDPMAGGGSIPLEALRLGLDAIANEYNPVACSVLEATIDYPFRLGEMVSDRARRWGKIWVERVMARLAPYYPKDPCGPVYAYLFARTVPCPDTGHPTPLVHDWSLSRAAGKPHIVAEPVVLNAETGEWTIRVRRVGKEAGDLPKPPAPTYAQGRGWSLFTRAEIPSDYIKAHAQQGRMGQRLYAIVTKNTRRDFRPPEPRDFAALAAAEAELARLRPRWEADGIIPTETIPLGDKTKETIDRGMTRWAELARLRPRWEAEGIIPTEEYPAVSSDPRPRLYGMTRWADLFAPRQLLAMGVLVEELRALHDEIVAAEGEELGEAVVHLLALALDKFANFNCNASRWTMRGVIAGKFDRHDFSFKATFAEMAACVAGAGLEWAIDNVLDAYEKLCKLPRAAGAQPVTVTRGSATSLPHLADGSVTAVVVDPPYADNVQYSELADFFYVWLKRTQGHRRPEWFGSYLSERDQEAVVNLTRHREGGEPAKKARAKAHEFYQRLMTEIFREAHRVLRDDGVLTIMFTHKQSSAWANMFRALIEAGFTITATWSVRTESPHSLHQMGRKSAQATNLLVARKREEQMEDIGSFEAMIDEILRAARETFMRLESDGFGPVDQVVGSFGPALKSFLRYKEVYKASGERVDVAEAIQIVERAVLAWQKEREERGRLDFM